MFGALANIFGSLLKFLYDLIGNYGFAIILFSVIVKIILIPISIKQQKSMKKATKMQEEMMKIQEKYGNDTEKINQEIIELYKKTGTSPFSGCFMSIIQILLIISVFMMVKSPLTYVKKTDASVIEKYETQLKQEKGEETVSNYLEIAIIKEYGKNHEEININMNFLGIDLSSVPTESNFNVKTYILPILYVITSIVSMKLTVKAQNTGNPETNKVMMYMVPIMSISIALVVPLGLILYWFMSNALSILERIITNKFQKQQEEVI